MSKIQTIDIYSLGKLQAVYYDVEELWDKAITRVYLLFDKTSLTISINCDDDTIDISKQPRLIEKRNAHLKNIEFEKVIPILLTRSIEWMWILTNQQGYCDGVQFEFVDPTQKDDDNVTIQFLAMASAIKVKIVNEI